jgi:hypothetical protein
MTCIYQLRWPGGFTCPTCGSRQVDENVARQQVCGFCGRRTSLTAGTLLHGSKANLSRWLRATWSLCDPAGPPSIKELQRHLNLPSYQTAWTWMTKMRMAMQVAVREKCTGTVQVDLCRHPGIIDRGNRYLYLGALEYIAGGRSAGRARMSCVTAAGPGEITHFIDTCVTRGSIVILPDRKPFSSVGTLAHVYSIDSGRRSLSSVQRLFREYSSWQTRRRYRPTGQDLLQCCLDEFIFHHNSRLGTGRVCTFANLLSALLEHGPVPAGKRSGVYARDEVRHEH